MSRDVEIETHIKYKLEEVKIFRTSMIAYMKCEGVHSYHNTEKYFIIADKELSSGRVLAYRRLAKNLT